MPLPLESALVRMVVTPVLRPMTRLVVGLMAAPMFRFVCKRVPQLREMDAELTKDIEQWLRGSVVLMFATKNFELWLEQILNDLFYGGVDFHLQLDHWYFVACRLLLAVGCIEMMPDQALFSIIYPGPQLHRDPGQTWLSGLRQHWRKFLRGLFCQHLARSSPVLAIMAVIFGGTAGWVCFGLAILQYLIIGLATSRDRALAVLAEFDRRVAQRRQDIIEEFQITPAEIAQVGTVIAEARGEVSGTDPAKTAVDKPTSDVVAH